MIRLLIDGTPITVDAKGVGRYAYQVCLQLARRLPLDWEIRILLHPASCSLFPDKFRAALIPVGEASELAKAFYTIPHYARALQATILLKTYEGAGSVCGMPMVTVCHDIDHLIVLAQGEKHGPIRYVVDGCKQYLQRRALRKSDVVVCNSEFTRRAVQKYYGITAGHTAIGYCAVDPAFYDISTQVDRALVRKKYGIENFILSFATGDERENSGRYAAVAAAIAELGIPTCLLVAGIRQDRPYAGTLRSQFEQLGLKEGTHFVFEGFLGTDRFSELVSLYCAANFTFDLSLHEGFGMQLAEAMACGTTCISSGRGALHEIGGNYAVFVDPTNVKGIARAIQSAYSGGLHARDNRAQIIYTRKFSWDGTGIAISDVLLRVAAARCRSHEVLAKTL